MNITNIGSGFCSGATYSGQQSNAIIREWSRVATASSSDAIKAQESVQNTIDHLRKPGASLHYLDLAECGLTSLPPLSVWRQLQGITILNLNQNNLLGKELEKLRVLDTLLHLNVSDNPLRQIPMGALANQKKLQTLEADGCELENFPEDILTLTWLDTLSVQDNPLHALPENIGNAMVSLEELNIQGTAIEQLPDSLSFQDRLVVNR